MLWHDAHGSRLCVPCEKSAVSDLGTDLTGAWVTRSAAAAPMIADTSPTDASRTIGRGEDGAAVRCAERNAGVGALL